jgi:membrane protease YdiL (CAAX protease family)
MDKRRQARQLALFFGATFVISWGVWAPLVGQSQGWTTHRFPALHVIALGAWGPSLCGLVFTGLERGRAGMRELGARLHGLRGSPVWYLVAVLVMPALLTAAAAIDVMAGASHPVFALSWAPLLSYPSIFGGPVNEELGWRGYALPKLLKLVSSLWASLLLGAVWAFWHAPLFLIEGASQRGLPPLFYGLLVIGFSVVMTGAHLGTQGSLLVAIIFHTAINVTGGMWQYGAGTLVLKTLPALWIVVAALVVSRRWSRWRASPGPSVSRH